MSARPYSLTIPTRKGSCVGTVYPAEGSSTGAAVVLGHGFGGLQIGGLSQFAAEFARAGLTAVTFDFRHFGDSDGEPRQLVNIPRQLEDWRAAVRAARALPGVRRVAVWGFSLSGGHVHRIAAEDGDIAACIAMAPITDGRAASNAGGLAHTLACTRAAMRDSVLALFGREHRIRFIGEPGGPLAAQQGEGLLQLAEGLAPQDFIWDNSTPARSVVALPRYKPGRAASQIECPILYTLAEHDTSAPITSALKAAEKAPRSVVHKYPGGHFDLFYPPLFEQVVNDQVAFLADALGSDDNRGTPYPRSRRTAKRNSSARR